MVNKLILKSDDDTVYLCVDNLEDFAKILPGLPYNVLIYHIREDKNDFYDWIQSEFGLEIPRNPGLSVEQVVEFLYYKIKEYLIEQRLASIHLLPSFYEEDKDLEVLSIFPPPEIEAELFNEVL